jgi:chromosome segregation ATPase
MDVGLRNQKSEIEDAHHSLREHDERMLTGDAQVQQLTSVAEARHAERADFEARCRASVASLRTDCDSSTSAAAKLQEKYEKVSSGLRNHKEEIRALRHTNVNGECSQAMLEHRYAELSAGISNHRDELRQLKAERLAPALTPGLEEKMQRLDAGLIHHATELRALRSHVADSVASGHSAVRSHLQTLDSGQQQHTADLQALRSEVALMPSESSVAMLSAGLHNHKTEIRSMRSTLSAAAQEMTALRTAGQPVTTQILGMQTRLDAMQNAMLQQTPRSTMQARAEPSVLRNDLASFVDRRPTR